MTVVGSAHVVIRALTDKLQTDIQDGLNKAIGGTQGSGANLGRAFSDSFKSNLNIDVNKSFDGVDRDARRAGAAAGAAAGAGVAVGMAAGARDGSQAVVAAAGRAGGSAGSAFGKMFNSNSGGGGRIFISMALRIAALLPLLGALVGGISSVVSGLFAMGAAANNAFYALAPLPGLVGALVQGGAVLMTAFGGVGTALSAGLKAAQVPAQDSAKALDGLKTAARDAAEAVRDAAEAVSDANEGISDAAEGIRDAKEAIRDAAEGIRDAREAVRDAAKNLKDAEEAAAESIIKANEAVADAKENRQEVHERAAEAEADAARRVRNAEEALVDSHKRVEKAQEALTDARKAAQERLLDLQFATRGGAIAEQRAIMALADARYKLNATSELPADNRLRQEAQLAYDEAQLNLEMTKERNGDTAEQLQEIREKGVEGTDEVVNAQENLLNAQRNVRDATESVTDALKNQQQVHKDVAEAIRDANDAVKDAKQALKDAYENAPEMISDAKEALRDANEALRDSKEAARDAKEGLSDAREAFSDAQEALRDALTALADAKKNVGQANAEFAAGIPQVSAYSQAMDNLSPPARRFVEFLISIKDRMAELRTAAAAGLFPGLQEAIENLVYGPLFPAVERMMFTTGQAVANAAISISESLSSGVFVDNFGRVVESNNTTIERMGLVVGDLAAALFAFMDAARPVTDQLTGWLVQWADGVRVSTELGNANGTLSAKLLAGSETMKQLINIVSNLWEGFSDLGSIAEKSGQSLLDSFEKATERFAKFTDNKENVRQLREDFDNVADNLREIGNLALAIGGAFFRLGADPAIGNIAKKLQPVVKTLEGLITGLLDRIGDDLVVLVDQILIAFDEISKSGAIEVFLQTMSTAVKILIGAFQTPVLGDGLRILVKIGAAMYALSILTKFPGISFLVKILPTLATLIGRVLLAMGPVGWVITAIGLLAVGFKILYERSETFRNIIDKVMGSIKVAVGIAATAFEVFRVIAGAVFDKIVAGARWLWDVLFGNSIFPDLVDAFTGFFDSVGDIFNNVARFFTDTIPSAASALFDWLTEHWKTILIIITGPIGLAIVAITENWETIKSIFSAAKDWVVDKFASAWDFVKDKIVEPVAGARDKLREIFGEGGPVRGFFSGIKDWVIDKFGAAWGFVKDKILNPIADARERIRDIFGEGGPVRNFFNGIKDWVVNTWTNLWSKVKSVVTGPINDAKDRISDVFGEGGPVRSFFSGIWAWIENTWKTSWNSIYDTIIKPIKDAKEKIVEFFDFNGEGGPIKKAFSAAVSGIKSIWDGIQKIAAEPVNFVINSVYNKGLRAALNLLPGVNLGEASGITIPDTSRAAGGVLPGWSPGKDVHHFYSPTAGRLHLSGGEAIMRPEFTRAVGGPGAIARLNRAAVSGMINRFASGGVFRPTRGGTFGPWHPINASDIGVARGTPVAAVKSGTVTASYDIAGPLPTDDYDGDGPFGSYGRVIKVSHGGGTASLYAHLSERLARVGQQVAAGTVIGLSGNTGNSSGPHLHFDTTGMSPFSFQYASTAYGTTAGSPQGPSGPGTNPGEAERDSWLEIIKELPGRIKGVFDSVQSMGGKGGYYPIIGKGARGTARDVVQWINDKIPDKITVKNFPDLNLPNNPVPNPFDRGGIASGETDVWLPKRTARPERVLSPDQTVAFERLVAWLDRNGGRAGGAGGDINIDVTVPQNASAAEVVEGIIYEMRRQQMGGRYT